MSTSPLLGRRVLVTRAAAQAGPLTERLRHLGATVVEIPTIAIEPLATAAELRAAARRLRASPPPRWMAVTSANAAGRLGQVLHPPDLADVGVAAVGEVTARALRAIGVGVDVVGPGTGAADLASQLIAAGAGPGTTVWLPQAEGARPELPALLRGAGVEVFVTACYRAIPASGLEEAVARALASGVDAVVLLSPSAAEALVAAVGAAALGDTLLVCGGETTAATIRQRGLAPVVASRSDSESVAAALVGALPR